MRYTIIALGILMLLATTLIACTGTETIPAEGREVKVDGGSYRDIAPEQLTLMLKDKDFPLVNVHIPYEGELPETDMFVPYNEVEQNISLFPEDRGAKMVLYCRSGSMSAIAVRTLVKSGYTNVWNLDGGMIEWEKQGYELIHKPQ
jgi:rhodanese-related sulfurtransferase